MKNKTSIKDGRHWDNNKVWIDTFGGITIGCIGSATPKARIPKRDFMQLLTDWLDLEGFALVKRETEPDTDRIFAISMLMKWISGQSISDESKKLINEKLGLVFRDDLSKRRLPKVDELTDEQKARLVEFYDTLLDGKLGEELAEYFSKLEPETKACPNPLCDGKEDDVGVSQYDSGNWFVFCHRCALRGAAYLDRLEAIESWNDLPRKDE